MNTPELTPTPTPASDAEIRDALLKFIRENPDCLRRSADDGEGDWLRQWADV
jgi:hypothetical protein